MNSIFDTVCRSIAIFDEHLSNETFQDKANQRLFSNIFRESRDPGCADTADVEASSSAATPSAGLERQGAVSGFDSCSRSPNPAGRVETAKPLSEAGEKTVSRHCNPAH